MDIKYSNDIVSIMPLVFATVMALLNAGAGLNIHANPHYMKFRGYKSCKTIGLNFFVMVLLLVSIFQTMNKK